MLSLRHVEGDRQMRLGFDQTSCDCGCQPSKKRRLNVGVRKTTAGCSRADDDGHEEKNGAKENRMGDGGYDGCDMMQPDAVLKLAESLLEKLPGASVTEAGTNKEWIVKAAKFLTWLAKHVSVLFAKEEGLSNLLVTVREIVDKVEYDVPTVARYRSVFCPEQHIERETAMLAFDHVRGEKIRCDKLNSRSGSGSDGYCDDNTQDQDEVIIKHSRDDAREYFEYLYDLYRNEGGHELVVTGGHVGALVFIASKVEDVDCFKLNFICESLNLYGRDVLTKELCILKYLDFKIARPLVLSFPN